MVARRSFFSLPDSPPLKRLPPRSNRLMRDRSSKVGRQSSASGNFSSPIQQVVKSPSSTEALVDEKFRKRKAQHCQARGYEALIVISVNIVLSAAALIALTRLVPYQTAQKERLDEITAEVQIMEERVNVLRAKLPQTFDSGKSQEALLRQQGWLKQNQLSIKILAPSESSGLPHNSSESEPSSLPNNSSTQNTARR